MAFEPKQNEIRQALTKPEIIHSFQLMQDILQS